MRTIIAGGRDFQAPGVCMYKVLVLVILLLFSSGVFAKLPQGVPEEVKKYREMLPDHSVIYHYFSGNCKGQVPPKWSMLVDTDDGYIIGPPHKIREEPEFIRKVFDQRPIQIYDYDDCDEGGIVPNFKKPGPQGNELPKPYQSPRERFKPSPGIIEV